MALGPYRDAAVVIADEVCVERVVAERDEEVEPVVVLVGDGEMVPESVIPPVFRAVMVLAAISVAMMLGMVALGR